MAETGSIPLPPICCQSCYALLVGIIGVLLIQHGNKQMPGQRKVGIPCVLNVDAVNGTEVA